MDYFERWNARLRKTAADAKFRRHVKTADDVVEHFQKRCMERIGIILNQRNLRELKENKKLRLLEKQSNTKNIYLLKKERWNGKQMLQFDVIVIYDKTKGVFVTTWKYDENWKPWHETEQANTAEAA